MLYGIRPRRSRQTANDALLFERIVTQAPPTSVHGEVLKFVRERLDARTDKVELTAAMLRATKALMEQVSSIRLFARCDQD